MAKNIRKSSRGNPYHWPAGSSKGGQFAPKGTIGTVILSECNEREYEMRTKYRNGDDIVNPKPTQTVKKGYNRKAIEDGIIFQLKREMDEEEESEFLREIKENENIEIYSNPQDEYVIAKFEKYKVLENRNCWEKTPYGFKCYEYEIHNNNGFEAMINFATNSYSLGIYNTELEAHQAVLKCETQLMDSKTAQFVKNWEQNDERTYKYGDYTIQKNRGAGWKVFKATQFAFYAISIVKAVTFLVMFGRKRR